MDVFTPEERAALRPYFTDLDGPVFALLNLPEVVKGALFARYSRSPKSLRRLFLDEFLEAVGEAPAGSTIGTARAEQLYARIFEPMSAFWAARVPREAGVGEGAFRAAVRARALDSLRGLLPAATRSNVGIFGTGQGYEALLLRMRAHPLREVRNYADLMLVELRKVIPAFLTRVDRPDRGGAWSQYLAETRAATGALAEGLLAGIEPEPRADVTLTDWDPDGEVKVVAAALYAASDLPDDQLLAIARKLGDGERRQVLAAYVGRRENRRHKPGRAFERTSYRFDVLGDYGAFRDLQRHRLLTLEWQPLSPRHGYAVSDGIEEAGAGPEWTRVMEDSAALHDALEGAGLGAVAPYAVSMAYRVRFYMELNAREAMHMIELRTTPQGHPAYRRICQAMHELIAEQAGHRALAAAMVHADHSGADAGRLEAERRSEARREGRA